MLDVGPRKRGNMKLTKEQRENIDSFIKNKWKLPPVCPVCHENSWTISPEIFELREFHGGDMFIGKKGRIAPLILLTCTHCGNTIFINALIAGVDLKGGTK